jgi:hypothetical protein
MATGNGNRKVRWFDKQNMKLYRKERRWLVAMETS